MDLLRNIFKGDKVIWIIFLFLCLISIVEVFSAASTLTYKSGDHWGPITQHSVILMIGVVIVVLMHNISYKWFQMFPVFLYPLSLGLLIFISIMGIASGDRINGAARWTSFMGIQFQPSELAKMAVVILVAYWLSKKKDDAESNRKTFKLIMIFAGIICAIIGFENFSTGLLLFSVVYAMMFIGQISWKYLVGLLGIGALLATIAVTIVLNVNISDATSIPLLHRFPTWKARILEFSKDEYIPPAKFDIDKNGQIAHAKIAIATSNVFGKAPGNSVQRDFLSQAFSDFIYAIIIEELGLIGGIFVLVLYIWLLIRAGKIANKCDRTFPAYLVMGIAMLLVLQALVNMSVAVGLGPVTGQPLPLISKGGTSTFINCAFIGMILSVSRYTAYIEEKKRLEELEMQKQSTLDIELPQLPNGEPTSEILNSDVVFEEDTLNKTNHERTA